MNKEIVEENLERELEKRGKAKKKKRGPYRKSAPIPGPKKEVS